MAYTTIDNPELYFQIKNYTGDGSTTQAQTFDGSEDMQSDLVWIKSRSNAEAHSINDVTRGVTKWLQSDSSAAEQTNVNTMKAFGTDGFSVGLAGSVGDTGQTYVAWCWNTQGGAGSSNTAGSINTTTTSVGQTQGMSISTYTGTGSNATVGHGLGAAPEWLIVKRFNTTGEWVVYHKGTASDPQTDYMVLHGTGALVDDATAWQDTAPTSTVFSIGTYTDINASGSTMVAYAWRSIQGFSKFGSYTGNANADGTFIYTGFKPKMLLVKSIAAGGGWYMMPSKTDWVNGDTYWSYPHSTTTESNAAFVDFHSNGFKLRKSDDVNNATGYIYACWAEAPFVNSNGVPCNAR